jgi:hypothetical protein
MRWLSPLIQSLFLIAWCHLAVAQVPMTGAGLGSPAAPFKGPGDIVSGALIWGSCARVYKASLALTSTLLCDLVSSAAPTVVLCTLRGSTSGFVDLSAYCAGALTPAATCAAAVGGICNVSKVYDQIGGTSGWVNTTAASQPKLTFSALSSLPGWTCTSAANSLLATTTTFTQAQPYTFVAVGERTTNTTVLQAMMGFTTSPNALLGFAAAAATAIVTSSTGSNLTQASVPDSAFHAMQGVANGTTLSVLAVDGVETTGNASTLSPSGVAMRVCRYSSGGSLDGPMMEAGFWPSAVSSGNRTLLNLNMHGTSGYNF